MNQILIVTCNRDRWSFLQQCRSIGKYLSNNRVNIVVNEFDSSDWMVWFKEHCLGVLDQLDVHVYTYDNFFDVFLINPILNKSGWISQQVFKLVFALVTEHPYLVLDTKNWLVRPTDFNSYQTLARRPPPLIFLEFYQALVQQLKLKEDMLCCPEVTPYKIDPKIVIKLFEQFGGVDKFVNWFCSFETPSEFIAYDLIYQQYDKTYTTENLNWVKYRSIYNWTADDPNVDYTEIIKAIADPKIEVLTINRRFLEDQKVRAYVETLLPFNKYSYE